LAELGIELIAANSAQAKGRIERLWGNFQDRLVKALREAGATNAAEANQVLKNFLPKFNVRFRVAPAQPASAYLPWLEDYRSEHFFCFKHTRIVTNDNTIAFDGHRLRIPPGPLRRSYAETRVNVWQHLDGHMEVRYHGESLVSFQPAKDAPSGWANSLPPPDRPGPSHRRRPKPKSAPPLDWQPTTPGGTMDNL
jgi:hypothetical protein